MISRNELNAISDKARRTHEEEWEEAHKDLLYRIEKQLMASASRGEKWTWIRDLPPMTDSDIDMLRSHLILDNHLDIISAEKKFAWHAVNFTTGETSRYTYTPLVSWEGETDMIFKSGQEMCEVLNNADLYNEHKELYAFLYNADGAICTYNISKEEAQELEQKSREYGEYWGAFLGIGGTIYDDPMEFCDDNFRGEWRVVS